MIETRREKRNRRLSYAAVGSVLAIGALFHMAGCDGCKRKQTEKEKSAPQQQAQANPPAPPPCTQTCPTGKLAKPVTPLHARKKKHAPPVQNKKGPGKQDPAEGSGDQDTGSDTGNGQAATGQASDIPMDPSIGGGNNGQQGQVSPSTTATGDRVIADTDPDAAMWYNYVNSGWSGWNAGWGFYYNDQHRLCIHHDPHHGGGRDPGEPGRPIGGPVHPHPLSGVEHASTRLGMNQPGAGGAAGGHGGSGWHGGSGGHGGGHLPSGGGHIGGLGHGSHK